MVKTKRCGQADREEDERAGVGVEELLPGGFLEKVKERGLVMNKWVQQETVLAHPLQVELGKGGSMAWCAHIHLAIDCRPDAECHSRGEEWRWVLREELERGGRVGGEGRGDW